MAENRMPYPARSFDMAHSQVDLKGEQGRIEGAAQRLCWRKYAERDNLGSWQKRLNHAECDRQRERDPNLRPHICSSAENPDTAWYRKMETCITPLPEVLNKKEVAGGALAEWPDRLNAVPPRIESGSIPGMTSETLRDDTNLWAIRVKYYKTSLITPLASGRYRNIMDMSAGLGNFAAALVKDPVWVMNVMPSDVKDNTLSVIYERGLIGTYQNWCEAFSTYPRTYDLLHANRIFSMYQYRCGIVDILLEMGRIQAGVVG